MHRRFKALLVGIIALALVWTALWWVGSGFLVNQADQWIAANSNEDARITHGPIRRGGFPLQLAAVVPDLVVAGPTFRASAPELHVFLSAWAPGTLQFQTEGPVALTSPAQAAIRISAIEGALDRSPEDRERLSVRFLEPTISAPGQPDGKAAQVSLQVTRKIDDQTPLTVEMEGKGLQSATNAERIDARFKTAWRGPLPGRPIDWAAWRDAGGEFALSDVKVTNGPASLIGEALFTLDAALRPVPKGNVTIQGVKPFMDRLSSMGLTNPRDAAIGLTALTLLAKPGADGRPEVTLPISGRDGWLMIGPLRTLRLPPLPTF